MSSLLDAKTFSKELEERTSYVNRIVTGFLPEEKGFQKTVLEAMNYSVTGGGKRIRPLLLVESYRAVSGNNDDVPEPVKTFAAALEFIHNYSLVHDDLPAMDNDMYRRGRKTTHAVYGAGMATLAGDGLLNYAYEIVGRLMNSEEDPDALRREAKCFRILSEKAGIYGMVGGQTLDVEKEGLEISADELQFIHENKTGALLEAPMMIGAVFAGADEVLVRKMGQAGLATGIAFQIQDDILDITSTTEELGKPVGSDEENGKNTYVSIHGMDKAKKDVKAYSEKALEILDGLDETSDSADFIYTLIHSMINRRK
ncbi:MAG: farnesyl diphosphate synthase [Lachnospiraceae bacterium]|jgi:geranylgeranyl diphosphate synthase type II|nr:farnesyl diphosphate synthase [Lachnospiraceae bacterium]MEE3461005.1 farnesyl diphosphate synthase [Lachnospiraceae bacterium]